MKIPVMEKELIEKPEPQSPFWDIAQTVFIAFVLAQVIIRFVVQPHHVLGASMHPTLSDGDYILTDKFSYKLRDPKRGEIVIFHPPQSPKVEYIKRIIGLPGETIEIKDKTIYINDQELEEPYLNSFSIVGTTTIEGSRKIKIPKNSFLVLGDNRPNSYDSRHFGLITSKDIEGRAIFRYWPIYDFKTVPAPEFNLAF